jgi:hypothetical protein
LRSMARRRPARTSLKGGGSCASSNPCPITWCGMTDISGFVAAATCPPRGSPAPDVRQLRLAGSQPQRAGRRSGVISMTAPSDGRPLHE